MELQQSADSTNEWDNTQKNVHTDDTSLGEKANAILATTDMKAKPMQGVEVKPNYKLYPVNLDETCTKGLIDAINSEKGVEVVARYNCTNASVSINIQLPLTPKQQRNVRVKLAGHKDAGIRLTKGQVKILKSSGWSGLSGCVMSLLTVPPYMPGEWVKPNHKLYSVNLDETCTKGLINAINSEKGVALVLRYNRTGESVKNNIQLPLTPTQLKNVRAKHARQQDAKIRITTTQIKFLKNSKGSGLLSSVMSLIPETQRKISHEGTFKIYHRDLEVFLKIRN